MSYSYVFWLVDSHDSTYTINISIKKINLRLRIILNTNLIFHPLVKLNEAEYTNEESLILQMSLNVNKFD